MATVCDLAMVWLVANIIGKSVRAGANIVYKSVREVL